MREKEALLPDAPKHHPSDVRFYLATGILIFIGVLLGAEVGYAMLSGCTNLQATLDNFGLFDAGLMALAGAISAFYFSDRAQSR